MQKFLRIFLNLVYNHFAWAYDFISNFVSAGLWKSWVLITDHYLSGPTILELGHGPGHLQNNLLKKNDSVYGIDSSYQMNIIATKRLQKDNLTPKLVNCLSQALPFPNGFYDQLVATFPTEYIIDRNTILEIYRILRNGGELIICPTAWFLDRKGVDKFLGWIFKLVGQTPVKVDERLRDKFAPLYEEAGFTIEVENRKLKNSEVMIMVCKKNIRNDNPME